MKQPWKCVMLSIALQVVAFSLQAEETFDTEGLVMERVANTSGKCKKRRTEGPTGPQGPQGIPGQPLNQYASFFMTQSSGGVDLLPGQNFLFNNQVALSGIEYNSSTGVFSFGPGTYSVTYFYPPFTVELNLYVNGQLILNSPIGGSSTIFTVTEPTNTLVLQVMVARLFPAPPPGTSIASIALFRID